MLTRLRVRLRGCGLFIGSVEGGVWSVELRAKPISMTCHCGEDRNLPLQKGNRLNKHRCIGYESQAADCGLRRNDAILRNPQ